ncbi:uncharacterized protein UTRI_00514_B [Ustilago trichophora]|uniref:Chromo domain-containing protein n=1 Tax=Ustilago trichophora TaxID=86804 RepID=A0A5C3DRS0_9BASI|nr:uncharacterized protein UTRI_00514_B [Ustilago trichophora]
MPPDPIALDSSDEETKYPIRSRRLIAQRQQEWENEVDELESDADDDIEVAVQPPPRPSPSRRNKRIAADDPEAQQRRQERRKKRELAKDEKRERRRAEKRAAAAAAAAKQNGGSGLSQPRDSASSSAAPAAPATLPSTSSRHHNGAVPHRVSHATNFSESDDAPLPSLVVGRASTTEPRPESRRSPVPMSEDEVEFIASQPSRSQNTDTALARSSSVPVIIEPEDMQPTSQRASSAHPKEPNNSGRAASPIELDSSDAPLQPDFDAELDDISDVSSVSYDDSEEYEVGAEFYTSSEGSVHASDSEDGLGAWTEYDKENWQGSIAHLDEAYDGNFDVRAVLRHRKNPRRGFIEYRTVWAGYPIYSSTWEPESHFNSKRTLREYWDRQGGRPEDVPHDPNEYSTHDSDTDVAVNRRPRWRAHAAKKKKRREVRRDKVQLRQYLLSLSEERAKAKAKEEERYAKFRRANRLTLDTERIREKGTSRSYQKRMEKMQQKKWSRTGSSGRPDAAGPSRFGITHANRNLVDVSMKARSGAASGITSARTRVSQLNDSIPEADENQMTFRRSAPNFPGLGSSTMAPIRDRPGFMPATARPTVRPTAAAGSSGGSGSGSGSATQAPAPRPAPGSFKGAHRREPKVQMKDGFGVFLKKLHTDSAIAQDRRANDAAAPPPQVPTDSSGRPVATARRPSEPRKPNLLVLKPVEDFKSGSRPSRPAATAYAASSSSSDAGDHDTFGIPEMSAVRNNFNPHQPAPPSDDEAKRAAATKRSIPIPRVEDPRRRPPQIPAGHAQSTTQAPWSPTENDVPFVPQDAENTASNVERASILTTPRSPVESVSHGRSHTEPPSEPPKRIVGLAWCEFVIGHNSMELEAAFCASESLSPDRLQTLGLGRTGRQVRFDMFMPFAWIRDHLARYSVKKDEAMLLNAYGAAVYQDRASLDQISEQLKASDVALLGYVDEIAPGENRPGQHDYFVAFSSKYYRDYHTGVPSSLEHLCGQPYTLCVIPLQLDQRPAPSLEISFEQPPPLHATVRSAFENALSKKIDDLKSFDIRKTQLAAQRYRVSLQLYEGIRGSYNIIFHGSNPSSYEKSILYYMVRIFEGGVRLQIDPVTEAKLFRRRDTTDDRDPKAVPKVYVFIRHGALNEILEGEEAQPTFALAPYLCQLKRHSRCNFWTFGFSAENPDERIREIFPGHDGTVTFSMSAILKDLLRSTMAVEEEKEDKEEGQLTQTDNTPPSSILCNAAYHLAHNWRVRLHPWIRPCFKLLADHLEPVCRALNLIEEHQNFPIELMFELDSKLETLYTSVMIEELPSDAVSGLPFEEPNEVPDEPEELVKRLDKEILATLHKYQLASADDTRFHVLVAVEEDLTEEQKAGVEVISLSDLAKNRCKELAKLPGN